MVQTHLDDDLITGQRAIAHPAISRKPGPTRQLIAAYEVTLRAQFAAL